MGSTMAREGVGLEFKKSDRDPSFNAFLPLPLDIALGMEGLFS